MTREYSRRLPNKAATVTKSNSKFFKYEPPPKPHTYIYPLKKTPCHSDTILRNDNRIKCHPQLTPDAEGNSVVLKHTPFFTSV